MFQLSISLVSSVTRPQLSIFAWNCYHEKQCTHGSMSQKSERPMPRVKQIFVQNRYTLPLELIISFDKPGSWSTHIFDAVASRQAGYSREKRHEQGPVILLHNKAKPYVTNIAKSAYLDIEWEVLLGFSYSLKLTPTALHLCGSWGNRFRGLIFKRIRN